MSREFFSADGLILNETTSNQYFAGVGGSVFNETSASTPTTISCTVGNTVADGSLANVFNFNGTINCSVGNAVAAGNNAAVTYGGTTTINCTVGNTVANGSNASVINYIVTDVIINNTGTIRSNQAISYTWWPAGRIGSMAGVTPTEGTGTTNSNGRFVTNIPVAEGVLMIAVLNAGATTDDVYYEAR